MFNKQCPSLVICPSLLAAWKVAAVMCRRSWTLTRVAFLDPTLALCTRSFLSPSCIPFSPAIAYNDSKVEGKKIYQKTFFKVLRQVSIPSSSQSKHKVKKHWLSTWALQPLLLCWTPYLVVKVDINIFAEGVSFRQASGTVLHQIEGLQGAKWCQQLLHLEHKRLKSKNQA